MEDRYAFDGIEGWTGSKGRGSNKGRVFLIEQENLDKGFKIFLLYMSAERLE